MAPYMMSVGLFVACMAFTLMYPLMEKNEEVKSGLQWWLSKVTVMAAVSIAQAVIMVAVLMGINGLEPHYVGKTFGMAVLASMAFMSLICFGEMLLNRVGSYVMLVFMVVQLGAAGGTYPLDMAPHFYTVLHKYMPFSYTVHAFRHTLSMDGRIGQDIAVFVGILVVSTLATIIFYRFRMKKQVEEHWNLMERHSIRYKNKLNKNSNEQKTRTVSFGLYRYTSSKTDCPSLFIVVVCMKNVYKM